jgi:hypothetical protein
MRGILRIVPLHLHNAERSDVAAERTTMRNKFGLLALLIGLVAMPNALQAQNTRGGFWFNGGLGWGSLGCQDCTERLSGVSANLALGGTLSQKVLLGVGTNGWTREEDGVRLSAATVTAQVRFYPSAEGGFYLLGGIGYGRIDLDVSGLGSTYENAGGALLGVGYDLRIGRNTSITPFWNGAGISNENGDANFGQFGLGITIH